MMQFVNREILHKLIFGGKNSIKKKRLKTFVLLENNQPAQQRLAKRQNTDRVKNAS